MSSPFATGREHRLSRSIDRSGATRKHYDPREGYITTNDGSRSPVGSCPHSRHQRARSDSYCRGVLAPSSVPRSSGPASASFSERSAIHQMTHYRTPPDRRTPAGG